MSKGHKAVILFGLVLMLAVYGCNQYSLCYENNALQLYERGSRGYELAQHNPNCTK